MNKRIDKLPNEAVAALWQGNKIEAIKIVRQAEHVDLKDAKNRVDDYVSNDPALEQKLATAQGEGLGSLVRWLLIIAALAIAGYYFLAG